MTRKIRLLAPALLAVLAVVPASAQTRDAPGRYTMQPVEGGFLRLDTQTGAVSTCRPGTGNLVLCQPAQEESQGLAKEIAQLRADNASLRAEVKRLNDTLASVQPAPPLAGPPPGEKFQLPTEEQVDGALDYVERMYKKFRDRLQNLQNEEKKPGTPL